MKCPDCGCYLTSGICSNCQEELFIYENQIMVDGPDIELSQEFADKCHQQQKAIK